MSDKLEHKHDLEMILNLVKSDAIAISYQSVKQYRENIIKEIQLCLNLLSERMDAETSHNKALHKHIVMKSVCPNCGNPDTKQFTDGQSLCEKCDFQWQTVL